MARPPFTEAQLKALEAYIDSRLSEKAEAPKPQPKQAAGPTLLGEIWNSCTYWVKEFQDEASRFLPDTQASLNSHKYYLEEYGRLRESGNFFMTYIAVSFVSFVVTGAFFSKWLGGVALVPAALSSILSVFVCNGCLVYIIRKFGKTNE